MDCRKEPLAILGAMFYEPELQNQVLVMKVAHAIGLSWIIISLSTFNMITVRLDAGFASCVKNVYFM